MKIDFESREIFIINSFSCTFDKSDHHLQRYGREDYSRAIAWVAQCSD